MTEQEVLDIIEIVCRGLASKYRFGYHDIEDIRQEIMVESIRALDSYDSDKGKLQTFLWTNAKNRLYNLKRNKFERYDKPCLNCPLKAYDPLCKNSTSQCTQYDNKDNCEIYYSWSKRNNSKKNLMLPICITSVQDENESNMRQSYDVGDFVDNRNIIDEIDRIIPIHLRSLWIKMKNDISISKVDKQKILDLIEENVDINYGT